MTRRTITRALAFSLAAGLAGAADAELPAVLDMVPADSLGGVVAPSLSSLDEATKNLFASVGMPVLTTPSQMLAEAGFGAGIDPQRPMAVVMVPGPMDQDEPPLALFMPTTDHGALMGGVGAADAGGGLTSFSMNGQEVFARSIGNGYTLIGSMREVISGFEAADGAMKHHASMMGAHGMRTAEGSVAFAFVNMPALEPLLADEWEEIRENIGEGMGEAMQMNPAAGQVDPEQARAAMNEMIDMAQGFVEDGAYGVMGLQAGAMGVGVQYAMDFDEGSETARMFAEPGDSASLMAKLPDQPFIFASATDYENSAAETIMNMFKEFQALGGMDQPGMQGLAGLVEGSRGNATALYPSPGGLMGGLFTGLVSFTSVDDPDDYVGQMEKMAGGDGPLAVSLTKNESEINGSPVHGWSMSFGMDPNNPASMQMMQVSQMLFGGPRLNGYLVEANGGVYQTMSKNLTLVQAAAGGEGGTLANNQAIEQLHGVLPGPAAAEMYIGLRSIYDMLSPMAAMMGMQVQTQVPADLPPVGMTIATGNGGFSGGMFVPAPVLRVGVSLGMEMQAMQNQRNGMQDQQDAPF